MKADLYEPYRYLQDSGVDVSKERIGLRFNAAGASESSKHVVAKALVSYVASRDYGYMTDSEVETVNVETQIDFHTLDEMYAVVNGYLSKIGLDVEIGKAEEGEWDTSYRQNGQYDPSA